MNKSFTVLFRRRNSKHTVQYCIYSKDELDSLASYYGVDNLLYIKGKTHVES